MITLGTVLAGDQRIAVEVANEELAVPLRPLLLGVLTEKQPSADAVLSVTEHEVPWRHWRITMNAEVVDPALEESAWAPAVVDRLVQCYGSNSNGCSIPGVAILNGPGATLVVDPASEVAAACAARGQVVLAWGTVALDDGGRVVPFQRPLPLAQQVVDSASGLINKRPPVQAIVVRTWSERDPTIERIRPGALLDYLGNISPSPFSGGARSFRVLSSLLKTAVAYRVDGRAAAADVARLILEGTPD